MVSTNFHEDILKVDVPVYIFQGLYDYQVSYRLAKEYFDRLEAPKKKFFTFENSAHSPITEEYERFNEVVINILKVKLSNDI